MLLISDEQLVLAMKSGDELAFTEVYNRYQPMLLLEAYYKVRSYEEAEDMVQEIFTSLWQRRKELNTGIILKPYLYKAVHLQYAYKCRQQEVARKFMQYSAGTSREAAAPPARALENKELCLQIQEAIAAISAPACRKAFELLYIEDKNHKEIAAEMSIKPQVVKNQVSRALKMLRTRLKKVV